MNRTIVLSIFFLLSLVPQSLSAQVNPQQGYIITNENDTVKGTIDNLTFTYNGNQVTKIEDSENNLTYNGAFNFNDSTNISDDYSYDKNGNLTKDLNKKIFSIQYNSLNLPSKINYSDGKMMDYVYSGTGEKKSVTYNRSIWFSVNGKNIPYEEHIVSVRENYL